MKSLSEIWTWEEKITEIANKLGRGDYEGEVELTTDLETIITEIRSSKVEDKY